MEEGIRVFAAIHFFAMGVSHVVQHRAWAEFFQLLHGLGRPGALMNGMLHLLMGSLIVSFHNVWAGIPAVLTIIGWGLTLKGAAVCILPEYGLQSIGRVQPSKSRLFIAPGVLLIVVSAALVVSLIIDG